MENKAIANCSRATQKPSAWDAKGEIKQKNQKTVASTCRTLFRFLEQGRKSPLGSEIFICLDYTCHKVERCKNFDVDPISHPVECLIVCQITTLLWLFSLLCWSPGALKDKCWQRGSWKRILCFLLWSLLPMPWHPGSSPPSACCRCFPSQLLWYWLLSGWLQKGRRKRQKDHETNQSFNRWRYGNGNYRDREKDHQLTPLS